MKQEATQFCQSCGMPLQRAEEFGTEKDGTPNRKYCIYCYKDGTFTSACTMDEMIEQCARFHDQFRQEDGSTFTREEAIAEMQRIFPHLERWKK